MTRLADARASLLTSLVAAVLILVYSAIKSIPLLLVVGPLVAFFGTGLFSGFGAITAEIYPTAVRAIAQGFTLNMGRLGSAAAPFIVGSLAETHGFGDSLRHIGGSTRVRFTDLDLAAGDSRTTVLERWGT